MQQALAHGTRTVMLHPGQVVLDVAGDKRPGTTCSICLNKRAARKVMITA
jgi:ABC-type uncharacterized transport system ATPase component